MAKKITVEEYEKSRRNNLKPEQKNKLLLPLEIMIVLFGCSIICIVILLLNNNSSTSNDDEITRLKNNLESEKKLAESYKEDLDRLTGDKDVDYIEEKLDFYDESVVYVIEGFGNYYYSYDCLKQKVGDNQFTYWTYNEEAAQDEGYRAGGC